VRPYSSASTIAWALAVSLVASARAQRGEFVFLGRVVSESGRALAGATVTAIPITGKSWIVGPDDQPLAAPVRADTGTDGRFRLELEWSRAALMVTTAAGLGAIEAPVDAQVPTIVRASPMAAVRRADGEPLDTRIRFVLDGGPTVPLGRRSGQELLLPPGRWMFLIEDRDRRVELAATLASGARHELLLPHGSGLAMSGAGLRRVWLDRWPELRDPLLDGHLPLLAAEGSAWLEWRREGAAVFAEFLADARSTVPTQPEGVDRGIVVATKDGGPIDQVRLSVVHRVGREWRLVSRSHTTADGHASLWIPRAHDRDLVVVAEHVDFAATWLDLSADDSANPDALRITLDPAGLAILEFADPAGQPLGDVTVRVIDPRIPAGLRTERANARGRVTLDRLPTGARVEVESRSHLPIYDLDLAIRPGEESRRTIVLANGSELRGEVRDAVGAPLREVIVELRDPSGIHLRSTRRAATDEQGRFVFRGIPDASFVLFAAISSGGRTHSARIPQAQPGETDWLLVLADEDPEAPRAPSGEPRRRDFRP
jgi:hypothetical protein